MDDTQVLEMIKRLKLFGMAETLMTRLEQAKANKLSYEELLMLLLEDQEQSQTHVALQRRIRQAKFEEPKSFNNFELNHYSVEVNQAIRNIMTGKFLKDRNHVIIMGPVGTGKTHLAQSIGLLACEQKKKVCFIRTNDLLHKFHQSRADESWVKVFNFYTKYDVLILDDFGLQSLSAEQSSDLYDLIAAIHVKSTLVITTNRKIEGWMDVFYDKVMANAALDRIINKAYRIVLDGESYRKKFIPKVEVIGKM
jgi:DNA replication protein DnaC